MDEFLKIDWYPPLEDMIEDVFINEERMKEESAMYRIMQGFFTDPFTDFESDDSQAENDDDGESRAKKTRERPKEYVPGLVKCPLKFPRPSNLTKEQHAACLRVLLRFSGPEKPEIDATSRSEMEQYMALLPAIKEEQEEFSNLAKSNWAGNTLKCTGQDYVKQRWQAKFEAAKNLPRYYVAAGSVPFKGEERIELAEEATLWETGRLPRMMMPHSRRILLVCNDEKLQRYYPTKVDSGGRVTVSEDPNCEGLAEDGEVDLVISSGGLNCLASNFGPNYSSSWILPVVVKQGSKSNVVYVDKPVPPTSLTNPQRNAWAYKYIMKSHLLHPLHCTSVSLTETDNEPQAEKEVFENLNSDDLLRIEEENEKLEIHGIKRKFEVLKSTEESILAQKRSGLNKTQDLLATESPASPNEIRSSSVKTGEACPSKEESVECIEVPRNNLLSSNVEMDTEDQAADGIHDESVETKRDNPRNSIQNHPSCPPGRNNVSYRIFTLGPAEDADNDCTKTKVEEYRILVRNHIDGIERMDNETLCPVMLVPKLEHQVALGAEAVTAEEVLKQWTMLTYRPNTSLLRIRIAAETSEVIQVERRTPKSLHNEMKRLYALNPEDSLITLHNVVQNLKPLRPGNYLLRHTPTNGGFATIYQESDGSGKNVFDLHANYAQNWCQVTSSAPWPPLDKMVVTPTQKFLEKMPVMFHPRMESDTGSRGGRGRGRGGGRGRGRGRGVSTGGAKGGSQAGSDESRGGGRGGARVRTKKAKKKNKDTKIEPQA